MQVLGQFNMGFIVARTGADLFILDQHACDEKVNFERLQQTTTIHQQPLIAPMPVEVTAAEEVIIMDNLDIFERNGFHFTVRQHNRCVCVVCVREFVLLMCVPALVLQVDDSAPATRKLKVTALPYSKSVQFGAEGTTSHTRTGAPTIIHVHHARRIKQTSMNWHPCYEKLQGRWCASQR